MNKHNMTFKEYYYKHNPLLKPENPHPCPYCDSGIEVGIFNNSLGGSIVNNCGKSLECSSNSHPERGFKQMNLLHKSPVFAKENSERMIAMYKDLVFAKDHAIRGADTLRNMLDVRDRDIKYIYLYCVQIDNMYCKPNLGNESRAEVIRKPFSKLKPKVLFSVYGLRKDLTKMPDHNFKFHGWIEVRLLSDLDLIKSIVTKAGYEINYV